MLYDGSKNIPLSKTQGWSSLTPPGTETVSGGGTTLNTTGANNIRAGYSTFSPLNRTQGYTLGFNLQLLSESHASPNRAGFSIIALSSDRRGIELGFWKPNATDGIWAQNDGVTEPPRFTHAEGTRFDPSRAMMRYDLSVKGNQYGLFANRNLILTGNLRNYADEKYVGARRVYNLPNFIFFGDNTESAQGSVRIARVDLTNSALPFATSVNRSARLATATVPEPMTIVGSGIAIALGGVFERKRRAKERKSQ